MKNWYHDIEAYLLGELPELEKTAFEQALQQDPELAQATEAHREVLNRLEGMRLRRLVQTSLQEPTDQSAQFRWKPVWWLLLLFAGGVGVWVFIISPKNTETTTPPPSIEASPSGPVAQKPSDVPVVESTPRGLSPRQWAALALKNQAKPTPTALRSEESGNAAEKTALVRAREAYHQGQYRETLLILKDLPNDEDATYYRANALFRLQRFAEADTAFKNLETSFQYRYEARWNRFLCQLASGKLSQEEARKAALTLANDETFELHEFAAELAEELKGK
ncbi:MAG TPA: hypothetical protein DCF33_07760 [Saprospirales bacterium]|nr:hypothetical protein [Saprospirales bacterium]